jgi:hypothetical protein
LAASKEEGVPYRVEPGFPFATIGRAVAMNSRRSHLKMIAQ